MKKCILLIILFSSSVLYANRHEHLYTWPSAESIFQSYELVTGKNFGDLTLSDLAGSASQDNEKLIKSHLDNILTPLEIDVVRKKFPEGLGETSLKQICDAISISPYCIYKRFLKISPESRDMREAYKSIEFFRNRLFLNLKKSSYDNYERILVDSYIRTAKWVNWKERNVLGVSFTADAYSPALEKLKKAMRKRGTKVELYFSVPRRSLANQIGVYGKRFKGETLKNIQEGMREGVVNGVDITGSINEAAPTKKKIKPEKLDDSLKEILSLYGQREGQVLKIHAFEGSNSGVFYDRLYTLLEDLAKGEVPGVKFPPVIIFGHIAALTQEDLDRLNRIRKMAGESGQYLNFYFEANPISNATLQQTADDIFAEKIRLIFENGFEVGLGTDGGGLFPSRPVLHNQLGIFQNPKLKAWMRYRLGRNTIQFDYCVTSPTELLRLLTVKPSMRKAWPKK